MAALCVFRLTEIRTVPQTALISGPSSAFTAATAVCFKSVYPRLSKEARDYRPYNYMSIVVYLADGTKVVYDDMAKRAKMLAA